MRPLRRLGSQFFLLLAGGTLSAAPSVLAGALMGNAVPEGFGWYLGASAGLLLGGVAWARVGVVLADAERADAAMPSRSPNELAATSTPGALRWSAVAVLMTIGGLACLPLRVVATQPRPDPRCKSTTESPPTWCEK